MKKVCASYHFPKPEGRPPEAMSLCSEVLPLRTVRKTQGWYWDKVHIKQSTLTAFTIPENVCALISLSSTARYGFTLLVLIIIILKKWWEDFPGCT